MCPRSHRRSGGGRAACSAPPPVGPLWRRAWWRAVLVPLPCWRRSSRWRRPPDHRFNIYWHGGLFRDDPLAHRPGHHPSLPATAARATSGRSGGCWRRRSTCSRTCSPTSRAAGQRDVPAGRRSLAAVVLAWWRCCSPRAWWPAGRLFRRAPSTAGRHRAVRGRRRLRRGRAGQPGRPVRRPLLAVGALWCWASAAAACRVGPDRARPAGGGSPLLVRPAPRWPRSTRSPTWRCRWPPPRSLLRGRWCSGLGRRRVLTAAPRPACWRCCGWASCRCSLAGPGGDLPATARAAAATAARTSRSAPACCGRCRTGWSPGSRR